MRGPIVLTLSKPALLDALQGWASTAFRGAVIVSDLALDGEAKTLAITVDPVPPRLPPAPAPFAPSLSPVDRDRLGEDLSAAVLRGMTGEARRRRFDADERLAPRSGDVADMLDRIEIGSAA